MNGDFPKKASPAGDWSGGAWGGTWKNGDTFFNGGGDVVVNGETGRVL